jgi:hypothetical protein
MSDHEIFSSSKPPPPTSPTTMPVDINRLTIEDLEMLLCIQREKANKEVEEQKCAEEEARYKAAEETARKAEKEEAAKAAKAKVRKVAAVRERKAMEVESGSEVKPRPSQKKGKGKARVTSAGSTEEVEDACLR